MQAGNMVELVIFVYPRYFGIMCVFCVTVSKNIWNYLLAKAVNCKKS